MEMVNPDEDPGAATADPVFQLNVVLWMLQPMHQGHVTPRPVLHEVGYAVKWIGAPLTAPAEVERKLATEVGIRGTPQPDVFASGPPGGSWPVMECKASAFAPDSSTAQQARNILARTSDVTLPAGAAPEELVVGAGVWVTRMEESAALGLTLATLQGELETAGLVPPSAGVIGLSSSDDGVTVQHTVGELPSPMEEALSDPVTVVPRVDSAEAVPRPLYIIPFDPGVTQHPAEARRCLQILQERARMEAASKIGRAQIPANLVLDGQELLKGATFGMSARWRETNDRAKAAALIVKHLADVVRNCGVDPKLSLRDRGAYPTVDLTLHTKEERDSCANAIVAASAPEISQLPYEQLELLGQEEGLPGE